MTSSFSRTSVAAAWSHRQTEPLATQGREGQIVLTDAVYDAIASTLPKGAARWPMQREQGQCFIQVETAVVDRMRAMRRPGESYSEVIDSPTLRIEA